MQFQAGSLVTVRDRTWVVMPSNDADVLMLRPLGGSEIESTGIFLPLLLPEDKPTNTQIEPPQPEDLGFFESAQLLYDASRLALRTGAGPFRSFGRLSVRPRSYQLVPLIMALRQQTVRLLIADDVGIGKTVEALLIVREMLDRGIIERFAVVCPPHLCDQWQTELKEKFGIEAVIIRSDTAARLDRQIHGDASVFRHFRYQVISVDYIKSETRRQLFISESPEMLIVDEAHTCARPPGANARQQQRHWLLTQLAKRADRHLLLLTATPHSGVEESFRSLLGLLHTDFSTVDIGEADAAMRQQIARHFVQRRRADVLRWIGEDTPFPKREAKEMEYDLSAEYRELFFDILGFARELVASPGETERRRRFRYWTALGLLRGVISSPAAGEMMLKNRATKVVDDSDDDHIDPNDEFAADLLYDLDEAQSDTLPSQVVDAAKMKSAESDRLNVFATRLAVLGSLEHDSKAAAALKQVVAWMKQGHNPIIFCRYIPTAKYLEELLGPEIRRVFPQAAVEAVTGELNDDQRKERIERMGKSGELASSGKGRRLLIATDCLSEGINLQEHFDAVLHYDLPWNPNRIEQREGRVDRYGQTSPLVTTLLLIGRENPIDGVVLRVLLRKAREIRSDTGVAVAFPEESRSVLDAVLHAVLLNPEGEQLALALEFETVKARESEVAAAMEQALGREQRTRSIFAQNAIRPQEIEPDLRETDQALGDPAAVEAFMRGATEFLGVQMEPLATPHCYALFPGALPEVLRSHLPEGSRLKVTFFSPVPEGHIYLGRNHPLVEGICQHLMRLAFDRSARDRPARAAVIRTTSVERKTTLVLFRVRNVISDKQASEIVAEEMLIRGFRGDPDDGDWLDSQQAHALLSRALPAENMTPQEQRYFLEEERIDLDTMHIQFDALTRERTATLIDAHERYRAAIGGKRYKGIEPVLPPDVMGVYVLLPALGDV